MRKLRRTVDTELRKYALNQAIATPMGSAVPVSAEDVAKRAETYLTFLKGRPAANKS